MGELEKKMLPIGIENFEEIRKENYYYVDKTSMIRDFLLRRGKVNLFTRPRRFGKSLNMGMFKCFFQAEGDKTIFDGLDISEETALREKYMGKFSVVSLSLKSVNGADYETARSLLCTVIGNEALRFYDLLESDKLTKEEKEIYRQLITVDPGGQSVFQMSDAALMGSLQTLSRLLERHFGRKTIILIDEYDVPLAKANEQGYYDQMILLIRNILDQALKTNDSLYFAILTGCLRVSKESIFTGLNNLKIFSITDQEFDSCFGFLDDEVREMLDYYELDGSYDRIKAWYDGYCFGDADIYCPWDVLNYVDKLRVRPNLLPQNYWANTSGNDAVRRLLKKASFQTRDEIEHLIAGETVNKEIKEELTYRELCDDSENVWSFLFASGYLTQRGEQPGGLRVLAIPNKEIHSIFMTQIREWMQDRARENQE